MKVSKTGFLVSAILFIVTIFLFNLFVAPHWQQLKAARARHISGTKLLDVRKNATEGLGDLRDKNREWRSKLAAREARFFSENTLHSFLKDLTRLAAETGNELNAIDPQETKVFPDPDIEQRVVMVTIIGRYTAIINFLEKLMNDGKLLSISELEIKKANDETMDLNASFRLSSFINRAEGL
ncbi:MAG: type 4a pilus biogenesis protein PilO [Candidatus Omnitrophica bacterium]|nr:type 4a pilus biogenesis protein PilO [Candidatus Omnitrophota bacterium]MBU1128191.1 type 4a pilus biogenesis protein PilO [Candidatus Omnitrophota bacterium]MBU1783869.1 type 4a pilus biogenesis protein PilO [Candidatus Omnitrophota bacterium]MBU1852066.1 type 4a pilus biogenesis protein PilO [Candidatus Omnitrophota bacterium]